MQSVTQRLRKERPPLCPSRQEVPRSPHADSILRTLRSTSSEDRARGFGALDRAIRFAIGTAQVIGRGSPRSPLHPESVLQSNEGWRAALEHAEASGELDPQAVDELGRRIADLWQREGWPLPLDRPTVGLHEYVLYEVLRTICDAANRRVQQDRNLDTRDLVAMAPVQARIHEMVCELQPLVARRFLKDLQFAQSWLSKRERTIHAAAIMHIGEHPATYRARYAWADNPDDYSEHARRRKR